MPRSRSMSIQSDTVPRRPSLPCTAPASGDDPGVQGQGLGERRLAGVGVADHGERTAPGGLRGGLGGCGSRHARRAHRVGPSCNLTGATSLRHRHRGHRPVATAMVRPAAQERRTGTGDRRGGPAPAQGCSASNSASATSVVVGVEADVAEHGLQDPHDAGGAVAPGGQVAELPPPQGLGEPAGVEVLHAVGRGRR